MFLIQSCMANPSLSLSSTLPPGIYEQASGGRPPPTTASPIARQNTGGAPSPVRPQYTGGMNSSGILQPQVTGQSINSGPAPPTPPRSTPGKSYPPPPAPPSFSTPSTTSALGAQNRQMSGMIPQQQAQWDVTSEAKATSDRFFTQLDTQRKGVIEGDVAVPFMLQSQLDEGVLASIW